MERKFKLYREQIHDEMYYRKRNTNYESKTGITIKMIKQGNMRNKEGKI